MRSTKFMLSWYIPVTMPYEMSRPVNEVVNRMADSPAVDMAAPRAMVARNPIRRVKPLANIPATEIGGIVGKTKSKHFKKRFSKND